MNFDNKFITGELAVISHRFEKEENFWLNQFSESWVKSNFPYDYPKALGIKPVKRNIKSQFTGEVFSLLMKLCKNSDAKLHMLLLSILVVLLQKYTGNSDIIISTPIYKQTVEADFINTVLAVKVTATDNISFKELLLNLRERLMEADAHRNYSLEMLMQKLQIPSLDNSFPLFDVALLIENIQDRKYLDHIPLQLVFSFLRTEDRVEMALEYNASLYREVTAERLSDHFSRALETALHQIDLSIGDIDFLSEKEKHRLLATFNDTNAPYPDKVTIQQLFEDQVAEKPDNIAVIDYKGNQVTYMELNEKSNRLAHYMMKKEITVEAVVGIMMDRSVDMAVGLISILKTGGTYLAIDPGLPLKRVIFMLNDSRAKMLLTHGRLLKEFPFSQLQGFDDNNDIKIRITAPRPPVMGFDTLPIPDRSHINLRNYKNKIGMASVTNCISLQTTRGCPYECLYCHKIWSKKHVNRSAENIYGEIEYFYKQGVTNFAVIDDCFNLKIKESRNLFQLIIKNKLKIQLFFPNGLRGDILIPDYIDLMVEAGTKGINLSLETASPRLQKLLKKNLELDKFKQVINYIAQNHAEIILEIATMHGFPSETEEEAMMTLNFIKDINWLHFPYIHILKIFPNTEMEAFALEQGVAKRDIMISKDRAFHELPETLPFPKSFTRKYQASFLNEYFLSKERLSQVLPVQMKIVSEEALVQKYNAYLPTEIKTIQDVIDFADLKTVHVPEDYGRETVVPDIFEREAPKRLKITGARRILFLDLSQHFSSYQMLYRVVEQPLGELYLLTYLKQQFGDRIDGRIYKSGSDFDSFSELKQLLFEFMPELIGIRTLTFFKELFHETVSEIRRWGFDCPIITGGPYASSDYDTILKDKNVQLVVMGEGEHTLCELVEEMLKNNFRLPPSNVLEGIKGLIFSMNSANHDSQRQVLLMDRLEDSLSEESPKNPNSSVSGSNLAYVMYTSGSTGEPKGVMVEHRQVNNCIHWMQEKFRLTDKDAIAQRTDLTFDPSVWEIFWPLYVGGKVKLLTYQQSRDMQYLIHLMENDPGVTMMYCPSPLVTAMTYLMNKMKGKPHLKMPWLIIGAESISPEIVKNFYSFYEGKIINTYGPTECTINNTYYDLDREDERPVVPIGRPISNNKIYILSPKMKLLPVNVAGEIHIAGSSVARGYINNREKTDNYFIPNPFGDGKLYKTGDIGRWHEDGVIEIMGRSDEQVKIRGYRIEPGEIRTALLGNIDITDCVVTISDPKENQPKEVDLKVCKICGITTKYPRVSINDDGVCGLCRDFSNYQPTLQSYFKNLEDLEHFIRDANQTKVSPYDCLLLFSGGRGAANALYRLHEMGFKILSATYDNGFMGKATIKNIKMITSQLNIDHIVLTHKNFDAILRESVKTAHTVCRGCFLTSSSLAAEYAFKNNINVVVGATLSRGQIIDNKLFMFLQQGIEDVKVLETEVLKFQKGIPGIEKSYFDLIDIDIVKDGSVYDKVKFVDFYRYCDMTNEEIISYLNKRDPYWESRKSYAIYSTNCPIKHFGDYGHMQEMGFHFYGTATSWEKRLGHLSFLNVKNDLSYNVTQKGYESFLKKLQYDLVKNKGKEDHYLCAYYVPASSASEEDVTPSSLRNYLLEKLPVYMVPNYFIRLEKIPLTTNGKVDKKALPSPQLMRIKLGTVCVEPRTELEKSISIIWKETLEVDRVGIQDNFFDLGGNSLNIVLVGHKLKEFLGKEIPVVTLFTYPTIQALARHLEQGEKTNSGKAETKAEQLNKSQEKVKKTALRIKQMRRPNTHE